MVRTSFGKLAIAVLAVSGVAAHADDGFLSKLRGSSANVEGGVFNLHSVVGSFLPKKFTTPLKGFHTHGVSLLSPVLMQAGPLKVMYRAGGESLYSSNGALYNASYATTKAEERRALVSRSLQDQADKIVIREEGKENGAFLQLVGCDAAYNASDSLRFSFGGGFGPVVTSVKPAEAWDNLYFAVGARVSASYKFAPNWAGTASIRGVMPMNEFINNVIGVRLGPSFTY